MAPISPPRRRDFLKALGTGLVAVPLATSCASSDPAHPAVKPVRGSWISVWWDDHRHAYWSDDTFVRQLAQLDVIAYQDLMNRPGSSAFAGHPDSTRLYRDYDGWLKTARRRGRQDRVRNSRFDGASTGTIDRDVAN